MKKMVQSYLVFTSRAYQIVSLVILPALFLVLSLILFPRHGQGNGIYPENYFGAYVITFEIVSDFRVFGGICNKENKGFPGGCNQGMELAEEGNDILLLNSDTIVTPRWLENMQIALYSEAKVETVSYITNNCSNW